MRVFFGLVIKIYLLLEYGWFCASTKQLTQECAVSAAGRRGARDEVKYLAILQSIIGQAGDLVFFIKIDRKHPLFGNGSLLPGVILGFGLGNIVKYLVVESSLG